MEDISDLKIECAKITKDLVIALYQSDNDCFKKTGVDISIETINKVFNAIYANVFDTI